MSNKQNDIWDDNFKDYLRNFEEQVSDYREMLRECLDSRNGVIDDVTKNQNKEIIKSRVAFLDFINQTIKEERAKAVKEFKDDNKWQKIMDFTGDADDAL